MWMRRTDRQKEVLCGGEYHSNVLDDGGNVAKGHAEPLDASSEGGVDGFIVDALVSIWSEPR
jgi:hypothetical protein